MEAGTLDTPVNAGPSHLPFAKKEDQPEPLQKTLAQVKKAKELAERTHRVYRERWDELYGLWRNYRRLVTAHSQAENDRDRGAVLLDAQREWGADLFIPYAFTTVETVLPRILSNDPRMRMRPKTPDAATSAQAVEQLINNIQLDIGYELKLQPTVRRGLMYGLGVQKTFQNRKTRKIMQTAPSASGQGYQAVPKELVLYEGPDVEDVEIRDFFWDPVARSIETCRWVIHRTWRDFDYIKRKVESGEWFPLDLEAVRRMQSDGKYAELHESQMTAAGISGIDLRGTGAHEVWEYHDGENVHTVLDGQLVVSSDVTPYYHRELPFQIYRPIIAAGEFVGVGMIEPIKHLQYELNTLRGQRRDNATVALQRPFKYREGKVDPSTLKIGPGIGIPVLGDPDKDLIAMEFGDLPGSAYQEEQAIKDDIERTVGVSDPVAGAVGGGTQGSNTATGIQLIQQAANERINLMRKNMLREVVRPAGRQFFELLKQHQLTPRPVMIQDTNAPGGVQHINVGPDQLLDDIMDPIPDADSTKPDDALSRQQNAENVYSQYQGNPDVDQRKLIQYTLGEQGIPNAENLLAPKAIQIDPQALAQELQAEKGQGPYTPDDVLKATETVIQQQQQDQQGGAAPAPGGQTNGG